MVRPRPKPRPRPQPRDEAPVVVAPRPRKRPRPAPSRAAAAEENDAEAVDQDAVVPAPAPALDPHTLRLIRLVSDGAPEHARYASTLLGETTASFPPASLWDVLGRLQGVAVSKRANAETRRRVAACVESVARHVPARDRRAFARGEGAVAGTEEWLRLDDLVPDDDDDDGRRKKEKEEDPFDAVLSRGRLLLADAGTRYDDDDDDDDRRSLYEREGDALSEIDRASLRRRAASLLRDRVRLQRRVLAQRLGLGGFAFRGGGASTRATGGVGSFLDDGDLVSTSTTTTTTTREPNDDKDDEEDSAVAARRRSRERLRKRRRKAKEEDENDDAKDDEDDADKDATTLRALLALQTSSSMSSSSVRSLSHLPAQTLLATDCLYRALDADWRVRRGALLCVAALLRAWRGESDSDDLAFGPWAEDAVARCLCVLLLDRFGDYAADASVAPVREAAASAAATLCRSAPRRARDKVGAFALRCLARRDVWEVRHGGACLLAHADAAGVGTLSPGRRADALATALRDDADEVRAAAARALRCACRDAATASSTIARCAGPLWWAATSVRDAAPCAEDLLRALAETIARDRNAVLRHASADDVVRTLTRFHDVFDAASVRASSLRALSDALGPLSREASSSSSSSSSLVRGVARRLFRSYLEGRDEEEEETITPSLIALRENRDRAWDAVVECLSASSDRAGAGALAAAATSRLAGVGRRPRGPTGTDDRVRRVDDGSRCADGVALARRLRAARALARLIARTTSRRAVSTCLRLLSRSPWYGVAESACWMCDALSTEGRDLVDDALRASLTDAVVSGAPICARVEADPAAVRVRDDPESKRVCDEATVALLDSVFAREEHDDDDDDDDSLLDRAVQVWRAVFGDRWPSDSATTTNDLPFTINSARFAASAAGAVVTTFDDEATSLPPRLTPFVRALVTSLRNETSGPRRDRARDRLVSLLRALSRTTDRLRVRDRILDAVCDAATTDPRATDVLRDAVRAPEIASRRLNDLPPLRARLLPLRSDADADDDRDGVDRALAVLGASVAASLPRDAVLFRDVVDDVALPLVGIALRDDDGDRRARAVAAAADLCRVDAENRDATTDRCLSLALPRLEATRRDRADDVTRTRAVALLRAAVEAVGAAGVRPFVRRLLPAAMASMTDPARRCAAEAASLFATLVRAAPLSVRCDDDDADDDDRGDGDEVVEHLIRGEPLPPCRLPTVVTECLENARVVLRDYQTEGVSWIRFLQRVRLRGALCDDMGLGKTLQALTGVAAAHHDEDDDDEDDDDDDRPRERKQSLVVCPATLVGHWTREISRFFPGDVVFRRPVRYDGDARKRRVAWDTVVRDADLVVANYAVLRNDVDRLASVPWTYVVLDEGHLLKNPKTATARAARRLRAAHKLVLTGTPVQNRVHELWAVFDFLMPHFLGDERTFLREFAKPVALGRAPGAKAKAVALGIERLRTLHQQVLPFVLRRTKDRVLRDLPPKIVTVVPCPLSEEQRILYERFGGERAEAALSSSSTSSRPPVDAAALRSLARSRLVCTHPALAFPSSRAVDDASSTKYSRLDCSGKFVALNDLLRHAGVCPDEITAADNDQSAIYARPELPDDDEEGEEAERDDPDDDDVVAEDERPADADADADDSVPHHHHHHRRKCLVFAQFRRSLDAVEDHLLRPHMPSLDYLRLDGAVPPEERDRVVRRFAEDPDVRVLLATTRVGGLGLNLCAASTVIFLESDWNPQVDLQATDRVHRLGQTARSVNVYRLVAEGTVEERIMETQKGKIEVANAVVNTENSTMFSMGTERLLDIFTCRSDANNNENHNNEKEKEEAAMEEVFREDEYADLSLTNFLESTKENNE